MDTIETFAFRIAPRQGGLVRRDQLRAAGFTDRVIDRFLRRHRPPSPIRGVYLLVEPGGREGWLRAAVAALPGAVVSHEAAAHLHGVRGLAETRPVVTVPARTTHRFFHTVVHRNDDLAPDHVVELAGLPVTDLTRTAFDLAAVLPSWHLLGVLDDLVTDGRLDPGALERLVADLARRGKPGITSLRAVLELRSGDLTGTSELERRGAELLAGIGRPVFEFPMPWRPAWRFDVAYPDRCVAVEWDSRRWHDFTEAFQRDRERDRLAAVHGWRVLRFTWLDVTVRPHDVRRTVHLALSAARPPERSRTPGSRSVGRVG